MRNCFTDLSSVQASTPIHVCRPSGWAAIEQGLSAPQKRYAQERHFEGRKGQKLSLPDAQGQIACVLYGAGAIAGDTLGGIRLGGLSAALKGGPYRLSTCPPDWSARHAAVGWGP